MTLEWLKTTGRLGFAVLLLPTCALAQNPDPPTRVYRPRESVNFLSFENRLHPENRIGYRIHEHLPVVAGKISKDFEEANLNPEEDERKIESIRTRPGVFIHQREVVEEGWTPQTWTFYFAPVETGFDVLWVVETKATGLESFYSAQQCFRMSGATNEDWRRTIAETPAFSEYDLWAALSEDGKEKESLSWFRRGGKWEKVPAEEIRLVCRTPLGSELEEEGDLTDERVLEILDPKHAGRIGEPVESGLITRTDLEGKWVCGLYWEGTTHVSNHHPADCLHAIVNLGPIPPQGKRAIRGRIYWMEASKEDLYRLWGDEFSE